MDRKEFLKKIITAGVCLCGAGVPLAGMTRKNTATAGLDDDESRKWIKDLEKKMIRASETPAWHKMEEGENWIRSLVDNADSMLDDRTKKQLLQACGRSCYINAFGVAPSEKPTPEEAERFVMALGAGGYEVKREEGKITIVYRWGRTHQNPWGLLMSDGYCMCPLVEKQEVKISPTFCQCSTGFVKELFERYTGMPANVELLDSLKMGGKDCVFKIELKAAG